MERSFKDKEISSGDRSSVVIIKDNIDWCIRWYHSELACHEIETSTQFNIKFSADQTIFLIAILLPTQLKKHVTFFIGLSFKIQLYKTLFFAE